MSQILVTFVLHSALRNVSKRAQATYQPLMRSCCSLGLPGGVRQAVRCATQVGLADSGRTFSLWCVSENVSVPANFDNRS